MPLNRFRPALSVLALCLGLVLVVGVRPAGPPASAVVAVTSAPVISPTQSAAGSATTAPTPTPIPAIAPGYRIKIQRLAIDLPITEGDVERDTVRQETPNSFAFHLPGTAIPGDRDNSYIYAHARVGMFLNLWNARVGDEVVVVTPDARELRYIVREVHPRVDPSDVSWAAKTATERLTLQTSTGPNPQDPRFVVVALPA